MHRNKHKELGKMRKTEEDVPMKEQNITSEKELKEEKISNLCDKEFKVMIIKVLER